MTCENRVLPMFIRPSGYTKTEGVIHAGLTVQIGDTRIRT